MKQKQIKALSKQAIAAKINALEAQVKAESDALQLKHTLLSRLEDRYSQIRDLLPKTGAFTCYKKAKNGNHFVIVELAVPAKALRSTPMGEKKSRISEAKVISITSLAGKKLPRIKTAKSYVRVADFPTIRYTIGTVVKADRFDKRPNQQCTNGIHCFANRVDAVNY